MAWALDAQCAGAVKTLNPIERGPVHAKLDQRA
jgi:hypothetical protein